MAYFLHNKTHRNELIAGLLGSVATCVLLTIRFLQSSDEQLVYGFLVWNLILAWIAWCLSTWLVRLRARKLWPKIAILVTWVLFLPNTFYILTDFIHPVYGFAQAENYVGSVFSRGAETTQALFDIMLMAVATWTGWLLGITSLRHVHGWLIRQLRAWQIYITINLIIVASSFAIYLGRIPRWNSWNVIDRPLDLVRDIASIGLNPASNAQAYTVTGLFIFGTTLIYWSIHIVSPVKHLEVKE